MRLFNRSFLLYLALFALVAIAGQPMPSSTGNNNNNNNKDHFHQRVYIDLVSDEEGEMVVQSHAFIESTSGGKNEKKKTHVFADLTPPMRQQASVNDAAAPVPSPSSEFQHLKKR